MRPMLAGALIALLLAAAAAPTSAQHRPTPLLPAGGSGSPVAAAIEGGSWFPHGSAAPAESAGPGARRVAVATAAGTVLGAAAGAGLVAAIGVEPADGEMFSAARYIAGAIVGAVPGMYIGARMGSGGAGDRWLTGAAAVGGTALGLVSGALVGSALAKGDTGKLPEIVGVGLAVGIPVSLTALAERRYLP